MYKRQGRKKVAKNRHLGTIAQLCPAISSQLRHLSIIGKLLSDNFSSTCSHNMVNFGPLMAEICWRVWGTPANFNGFCVLAALLHGTPAAGVSQTLRRGTRNGITELSQRAPPIFGWATIALGIGPHSSCFEFLHCSFLFGSVRQIKLAVRYLLSARKYSVCCIPHSAASVRTITRLAAPNSKRR